MKKLSKEQMKTIVGGTQEYWCSCNNGSGTWHYPGAGGGAPPQEVVSADVQDSCGSGQGGGSCGYVTCGNPGAPC